MPGASITILGSGTCVPSLERSSCSVLIEIDTQKILFDLGAGTMRRLLEKGISISDITHLVFSHFHPDHTGELVSFLFALKYGRLTRKHHCLHVIGCRGLGRFYTKLHDAFGSWIDPAPRELDFVEMSGNSKDNKEFDSFDITSLPMNHIESSLGYRISTPDGLTIVYSGDTDFCDNLIEIARNAKIFICESAFPDELKAPGHLTPSLAGKAAADASVGHLVLTHFYPECDLADMEAQCRRSYTGKLTLAADLLTIDPA